MPVLLIASLALQVLCVIHVMKTGRERYWILVVVMMPLVGCLAYFVCEIVPELMGTRAAHKARGAAMRLFDPDKEYREAQKAFEISPTPHNRRRLAEACIGRRAYDEAIPHYRAMLTGHDADDPTIMRALARVQFLAGDYGGTLETLDALKRANPSYESGDAHLLYARALDELGRHDEAIAEYRALAAYYNGEEARGRLVLLLRRLGRDAEADENAAKILRSERLAPKHYVRANRDWIDVAKRGRG